MEIEYVPGGDSDFVVFIKSLGDKAQMKSIDGHARWIVTREDETQYIARPWETNPDKWTTT